MSRTDGARTPIAARCTRARRCFLRMRPGLPAIHEKLWQPCAPSHLGYSPVVAPQEGPFRWARGACLLGPVAHVPWYAVGQTLPRDFGDASALLPPQLIKPWLPLGKPPPGGRNALVALRFHAIAQSLSRAGKASRTSYDISGIFCLFTGKVRYFVFLVFLLGIGICAE